MRTKSQATTVSEVVSIPSRELGVHRLKKVIALLFFVSLSVQLLNVTSVHAASSVKVWLQVMDSCRQALPGANFMLIKPNGSSVNMGPSAGKQRVTVSSGSCPLQRGNCQKVSTGCLSWIITPPSSGMVTYHIVEKSTWDASDKFYENPPGATSFTGFVPCNGGSACRGESATFAVDASGTVSGTTTNIYPDNARAIYPSGGTFAGTQTDPIVFHNFQLGNGSCDGDNDADDHLTGSPSSHCDSDKDK
jgi:hypothetical protein